MSFCYLKFSSFSLNWCTVLVPTMSFDVLLLNNIVWRTISFLFVYNLSPANVMGCSFVLVLGEGQSSLSICLLHGTQDFIHLQHIFPLLFLFRLKMPPLVGKQFHTCANLLGSFSNSAMSFLKRATRIVHTVQDTHIQWIYTMVLCFLFFFSFPFLGIFNVVFITKHWGGIFIGLSVITFHSWVVISEPIILYVKLL